MLLSPRSGLIALAACTGLLLAPASAVPTADKETGSIVGKVIFEGKPVAKGKIAFHTTKGKPITVEIKDGDYSAKGVPVGEGRVTVKGEGLPEKYADLATTPLIYKVVKGKQTFDIQLKN